MMQPVSIASTGGKSDGKRSGSGSGKQLHECRVLSKVASQVVQQSRASASSGRGGSSISSRRASSHRTSNRAKPQDQQQDAATSYVTTETGSGVHGGGGGGDGAVPAETCFANLSYIYPEELSLLQDELGSGTGGKVFKCKYGITDVAIKVFDINYLENNNEAIQKFKDEAKLNMLLTFHPNIIGFMGVSVLENGFMGQRSNPVNGTANPAIVMEFCPMNTLYKMIRDAKNSQLQYCQDRNPAVIFQNKWTARLQVLRGAAEGLAHMHKKDVIHRDFTSYNLLLKIENRQWSTKVCDFNFSEYVGCDERGDPLRKNIPGGDWSPAWQSPEFLKNPGVSSFSSDVFSFGVVIWEVATLKRPWEKKLQADKPYLHSFWMQELYKKGKRLKFPEDAELHLLVPSKIKELCERCWREEPQERPSMRQVADELMRLHKKVQEYDILEQTRAAAAASLQQQGGAAAAATAAAVHNPVGNRPSAPAPVAAAVGTPADAEATQGHKREAATVPPQPSTPQVAAAPAAAGGANPPPSDPVPCRPRALVSPFAATAGPRLSASPGTSPGTGAASIPRQTRMSPFLTAQQNADA